MKAWHFLNNDKRLAHGDGRLVRVGHTLKCNPDKIELCHYGFHGSQKIMDALKYAYGDIVCRVELGGRIIKAHDKCVASERTVIAMADAGETLHLFACWCAEQALQLVENPDPRSIAAIQAKYKWLRGEITDNELDAARDAARDATWTSGWASMNAARSTAVWASSTTSWNTERHAARNAIGTDLAARDAVRAAQNLKLTRMVKELLK